MPMGNDAPESQGSPPTPPRRRFNHGTGYRRTDWATHEAPVPDLVERKILELLAERADFDGMHAWPGVPAMMAATGKSDRTVQRRLRSLEDRGLIRQDNSYPAPPRWLKLGNKRPQRYIVMIPAEAWPAEALEEINAYRLERGRPPITPASHPPIAPPPPPAVRADAGKTNPNRRRKATRAAEAEAAAALEAAARTAAAAAALAAAFAELVEGLEDVVPAVHRGDTQTQGGVSDRPAGGDCETPNLLIPSPPTQDQNPSLAVGDHVQVVRGSRRAARAGTPSKRSRGQETPRRPRRGRPLFTVSAEAVEVYRAAIPSAIKRYIPEHAVGRVLAAITAELERLAAELACDAPAELARQIAERAEPWRYRMPDARDPVAVVTGLIVRGPKRGPAALLPWCGRCEGPAPARRFLPHVDGMPARRCPDCHPALAADQAVLARQVSAELEALRAVALDGLRAAPLDATGVAA